MSEQGTEKNQAVNETKNAIQQDLESQLQMFGAIAKEGVAKGENVASHAKTAGTGFAASVGREYDTVAKKQWSNTAKVRPGAALGRVSSARNGLGMAQSIFGALIAGSLLAAAAICLFLSFVIAGASSVLLAVSVGLLIGSIPFWFLFSLGKKNLEYSKRIKRYVATMGADDSISLADLVEDCGYPKAKVLADVRTIMKNNWCPMWFAESQQVIYLSQEAYRAAKGQMKTANTAAQVAKAAQAEPARENNLLDSIESFIAVLGKQKTIMQEEDAVQELTKMQSTCGKIHEWLKGHPESAPRMRRFTNYYMPTTMKLLYSYNDVQAQQGENAQSIRHDIGRFLHTLNTAFDNLHDSLLSSVSLDVSAEISALKGMLAQDGLSEEDDFGAAVNLQL